MTEKVRGNNQVSYVYMSTMIEKASDGEELTFVC
jgi:hypothetical protein